MIDPLGA